MSTTFAEPPRKPRRKPSFAEVIDAIDAELARRNGRIAKSLEETHGLVRIPDKLTSSSLRAPKWTKRARSKRGTVLPKDFIDQIDDEISKRIKNGTSKISSAIDAMLHGRKLP